MNQAFDTGWAPGEAGLNPACPKLLAVDIYGTIFSKCRKSAVYSETLNAEKTRFFLNNSTDYITRKMFFMQPECKPLSLPLWFLKETNLVMTKFLT